MPVICERTFRVRHSECDAYGHMNHANYLRYMQEAAFDASAAVGYDMAWYDASGYRWLIRETEIDYLRPLQYDDRVQVRTWVEGYRRVRSRRAYEFRLPDGDGLAARANTDWVYTNAANGRPAAPPRAMMAAFFPDGGPLPSTRRARFPATPPAPAGAFTSRQRVEWRDIDPAQHVNNAAYLAYIEECGMRVVEAFGWPVDRMWGEGFAVIVRRHQIEYLRPAVYGDDLAVATWVSLIKRTTAVRHFVISRPADGAVLVRVHTLWVWVDLKTGRPIRIPDQFLTDFAPNIIGGWPPAD